MTKHVNSGMCPKCHEIIDRYPGFNKKLLGWFVSFQSHNPEFHVSCAGRGKDEQDFVKQTGASLAGWKQSAHNWNAALDLFILGPDGKALWDAQVVNPIYKSKLQPAVEPWMSWYGRPNAPFPEPGHVELHDWLDLSKHGMLALVDKDSDVVA